MKAIMEVYNFNYKSQTSSGLDYEIDGGIWYDKEDKRYKYHFVVLAPNDVVVDVENLKGFINIKEAIEEINDYKPNENELLRLVYINS